MSDGRNISRTQEAFPSVLGNILLDDDENHDDDDKIHERRHDDFR